MSTETICPEKQNSPVTPVQPPQPELPKPAPKYRYPRKRELSPQMRILLEEEIVEAEVQTAIDHAAEEGENITREQAIEILLKKPEVPEFLRSS